MALGVDWLQTVDELTLNFKNQKMSSFQKEEQSGSPMVCSLWQQNWYRLKQWKEPCARLLKVGLCMLVAGMSISQPL